MNIEENILFDIDTAVPLGIIINEIFTNSLKYAFPDRKSGEILISLVRKKRRRGSGEYKGKPPSKRKKKDLERESKFILTISDNGIGIPETFDIEKSESLGLQLIHVLIAQLNGKIKLNRNNGTEYVIEFTAEDLYK